MKGTILALLFVLMASAVRAEDTPAWPVADRKVADVASYVSVASQIGFDTWTAWHQADRKRALTREALRMGTTIALSEVVKRLVHRERPDKSDNLSFWSEHTALAAAGSGWNLAVSIPLTFSSGYLRMAADRHHPSDVIAGAIVGGLVGWKLR